MPQWTAKGWPSITYARCSRSSLSPCCRGTHLAHPTLLLFPAGIQAPGSCNPGNPGSTPLPPSAQAQPPGQPCGGGWPGCQTTPAAAVADSSAEAVRQLGAHNRVTAPASSPINHLVGVGLRRSRQPAPHVRALLDCIVPLLITHQAWQAYSAQQLPMPDTEAAAAIPARRAALPNVRCAPAAPHGSQLSIAGLPPRGVAARRAGKADRRQLAQLCFLAGGEGWIDAGVYVAVPVGYGCML